MSELSRETRALLERGRAGTPLPPALRAKVKAAVLANAAGVAIGATTSSAAARSSLAVKIGVTVGLLAAVGGASVTIAQRVSNQAAAPMTALGAKPANVERAQLGSSTSAMEGSTWSPVSTAAVPVLPAIPPVASSMTTRPASILIRPAQHGVRPALSAGASRAWPSAENRSSPTAHPSTDTSEAPTARQTVSSVPLALSSSAAVPPSEPAAPDTRHDLARDIRLLRDADLAIKAGDPERALELLDEHAAAFPQSELEPERSAERVFAFCRAGRIDDARSASRTFLSAHPTGPLAIRVRAACFSRLRE